MGLYRVNPVPPEICAIRGMPRDVQALLLHIHLLQGADKR